MEIIGIIPARIGSTRLPKKMLLPLCGKPLIMWTLEAAKESKKLKRILVATDSEEIRYVVEANGGEVVMTSPHHRSGTERIGEVARKYPVDAYINIQGDEPLIKGLAIDLVVEALEKGEEFVSLFSQIKEEEINDPNVVKLVLDKGGYALLFSRSPIPYPKPLYKHIGIYGYSKEGLDWFLSQPPSPLEGMEKLEQLRILYYGKRIKMLNWNGKSISVDTQRDLEKIREVLCGEKD